MSDKVATFLFFLLVAVVVIAVRVSYAELVYNDMRCVVAECRIVKD